MSTHAKMDGYDATALLPNPPEKRDQTAEEMFSTLAAFATKHNAKVN